MKFNRLTAQREYGELNISFERISRVTIFILVPLAALLALLGFDLVSFLFGHGRFRGEALHLAGLLFSIFVLNLPMTGFMTLTARYLVARQAIRYGVLWQIFSNVFNAIVVITIHFWGPVGYPIGPVFICWPICYYHRLHGSTLSRDTYRKCLADICRCCHNGNSGCIADDWDARLVGGRCQRMGDGDGIRSHLLCRVWAVALGLASRSNGVEVLCEFGCFHV